MLGERFLALKPHTGIGCSSCKQMRIVSTVLQTRVHKSDAINLQFRIGSLQTQLFDYKLLPQNPPWVLAWVLDWGLYMPLKKKNRTKCMHRKCKAVFFFKPIRGIVTGCSIIMNHISIITKLSVTFTKKGGLGKDHPPSLIVCFQMWCLESQSQYKQACLPLSVGWNQAPNSFPEWVMGGQWGDQSQDIFSKAHVTPCKHKSVGKAVHWRSCF